MAKQITISGILAAVIIMIALGTLPSGDVTDSKSTIKNTGDSIATDAVVKAGGDAMKISGEHAIESACKNGSSQGCSTATSSVNLIGVLFTVLVIVIIIVGVIGLAIFVKKVFESFGLL